MIFVTKIYTFLTTLLKQDFRCSRITLRAETGSTSHMFGYRHPKRQVLRADVQALHRRASGFLHGQTPDILPWRNLTPCIPLVSRLCVVVFDCLEFGAWQKVLKLVLYCPRRMQQRVAVSAAAAGPRRAAVFRRSLRLLYGAGVPVHAVRTYFDDGIRKAFCEGFCIVACIVPLPSSPRSVDRVDSR